VPRIRSFNVPEHAAAARRVLATEARLEILRLLTVTPWQTGAELARATGSGKTNIQRNIAQLRDDQVLVADRGDDDRRSGAAVRYAVDAERLTLLLDALVAFLTPPDRAD
jgi:DNA-binding transcriptional ArsR family regulator